MLELCELNLGLRRERVFTVTEFVAAAAWLTFLWSIAGTQARFRVVTAPINPRELTFGALVVTGALVLLNDVWVAIGGPVLCHGLLQVGAYEGILAAISAILPIYWIAQVVMRPAVFGKATAHQFAAALPRMVVGRAEELSVVATELERSLGPVIRTIKNTRDNEDRDQAGMQAATVLLAMGSARFAEQVVCNAPGFIYTLFHEMEKAEEYPTEAVPLVRNIMNSARADRNSFLYEESTWYDSGLVGHHRPIVRAVTASAKLLTAYDDILRAPRHYRLPGDRQYTNQPDLAEQHEAYRRLLAEAVQSHSRDELETFPNAITGALTGWYNWPVPLSIDNKRETATDVGRSHEWLTRNRCQCLNDTINILDKKGVREPVVVGNEAACRKRAHILDCVASCFQEVAYSAGSFKGTRDEEWGVMYRSAWRGMFPDLEDKDNDTRRAVQQLAVSMIKEKIETLEERPNYVGAAVLRFCLTLASWNSSEKREEHAGVDVQLLDYSLEWTKRNFKQVLDYSTELAGACLPTAVEYDRARNTLARTYYKDFMKREKGVADLQLDTTGAR